MYNNIDKYSEMIDEKFQALEKTLAKELEQIKALLDSILEKRNDPARVVKMFDDRREDKRGILSPRRPEIMNFNNTIQRISSVNGLYIVESVQIVRSNRCTFAGGCTTKTVCASHNDAITT